MIKTLRRENGLSSELSFGSQLYQKGSRTLLHIIPFMPSHSRYNITICHEKKFIWFRVAKVGTRTIFDLFKNGNLTLEAEHPMFCHYPPGLYKDYFKFAFVRNPWDRLVSCWENKVLESNYFDFSDRRLKEMRDLSQFVDYVNEQNIETCDHHIRLQSKLIDLNNINYLGRFENFENDLLKINKTLGISHIEIGHKNSSNSKTSYRDYYDSDTKQKVYKIYERDINIFSYEF